jgi:5'-nucleotidase
MLPNKRNHCSPLKDPATYTGGPAANLAQQLITNAKSGRIPQGYGVSVNVPLIASVTSNSRINPPFIHAHLTGGADIDSAAYKATIGSLPVIISPHQAQINASTATAPCHARHHFVLGCQSSVSVFTVDYDAPL